MKPNLALSNGRLRPLQPEDLDDLAALLHAPEVRRYLCDDIALPHDAIAEMLDRSAQLDKDKLGLWVIEDASGHFAGIAGLEPVSSEADILPQMAGGIEPVVALNPDSWGHGLAVAALGALVTHARDGLGLEQLVGAVDQPNTPSHAMMRRCGFQAFGSAPGPAHELVLYQLLLQK